MTFHLAETVEDVLGVALAREAVEEDEVLAA